MSGQSRSSPVDLDRSVVCFSIDSRLRKDHVNQISCTASSILVVGQVGQDLLLLTWIDPCFILLKSLDLKTNNLSSFALLLLHILYWIRFIRNNLCYPGLIHDLFC